MSGVVGFPVTGMLAFDQVFIDLMNAYAVPGAALAVSRNGTVIIERGYGLLDIGVIAGLPAAGNPYVSVFGEQQHFTYRDASGTIQDAWYDSGSNSWNLQQINQGAETAGAAAAGDPFVSVFGLQQHFAYRDAAGAILDAWYEGGTKNR